MVVRGGKPMIAIEIVPVTSGDCRYYRTTV